MLNYSAHAKQQQRLLSPTDTWVVLLQLIHTGLSNPVCMVVDTVPIVSNGDTYMPIGAALELPSDDEGSHPSARITIDNVGRSLMRIVEDTHGLRGAQIRIMQVYRSRPNIIEQEYTMDAQDISVDQKSFSCALSYDNVLDRPSTPLTYRPSTKPSLF
jgi:hypothetical protein